MSKLTEKGLCHDAKQVLYILVLIKREVGLESGEQAFHMQIRPYRDTNSVVCGMVVTFIDITDRKCAELDYAHLAAIVSFVDDTIISYDLEGIVTS